MIHEYLQPNSNYQKKMALNALKKAKKLEKEKLASGNYKMVDGKCRSKILRRFK